MIVTLSEKAARSYLMALEAEGVAASLEIFNAESPYGGEKSVAVMVVPLLGFEMPPYDLVVEFLAKLIKEGYAEMPPAADDEAPARVPSGNTGPNFTHKL